LKTEPKCIYFILDLRHLLKQNKASVKELSKTTIKKKYGIGI